MHTKIQILTRDSRNMGVFQQANGVSGHYQGRHSVAEGPPEAQQKAAKASYLLARPCKRCTESQEQGSFADTAQIQLDSAGFRAYLRPFRGSHAPYRIGAHRGGQGLPTEPFTAIFDSVVWVLWLKQPKSCIF